MRLRTDIFVSALLRRAQGEGAYVAVARRGAAEAGALFILVRSGREAFELFGPAPQTSFSQARPSDRLFIRMLRATSEAEVARRLDQEMRFDPDLWLVEIDDARGRPFVDLAPIDPET